MILTVSVVNNNKYCTMIVHGGQIKQEAVFKVLTVTQQFFVDQPYILAAPKR